MYVGHGGSGRPNIKASVTVNNNYAQASSEGVATVTATCSQWNNRGSPDIDRYSGGTVTISRGALVSVGGVLSVSQFTSRDDSFINLSTGERLALATDQTADDSLDNFLALVEGTGSIRY